MPILKNFITSNIFFASLFSWFVAQILKVLIDIFKKREYSLHTFLERALFGTGGMPSSHSAMVTALTTSIGFEKGVDSPLFALSFFFSAIVLRDATGVRRAAGIQAKILNQLIRDSKLNIKEVKEVMGHTNLEVVVGVFIGFFIAIAIYLLR